MTQIDNILTNMTRAKYEADRGGEAIAFCLHDLDHFKASISQISGLEDVKSNGAAEFMGIKIEVNKRVPEGAIVVKNAAGEVVGMFRYA